MSVAEDMRRDVEMRFVIGAAIRTTLAGQEAAPCLLGICEALADMVEDDRLPDVETAVGIIQDMTAQIITDRHLRRKHQQALDRARAL